MHTAIIIPTYNECENVPLLVEHFKSLDLNLTLLIVDDNSPDGTGAIADELSHIYPWIHVIHRSGKLGLGTAYLAGFQYAMKQGAQLICTMDADFSHDPSYIPHLLAKSNQYDIVIGSRYVPGGGTKNWPWPRILLSWGANTFARFMLNLKSHDCTAGFRCYHRYVLESLALESIVSNGYSFLLEILYQCECRRWQIGEIPILFIDRQYGSSKISKQEISKAAKTVLRLCFQGNPSKNLDTERSQKFWWSMFFILCLLGIGIYLNFQGV
ncbi:dolichol-phosphate mannosyltransferase [Nostoc sp. NIES-4103]|nr:dolichol-phosphate mannosyltransferase [Nostoc sp. NIES-4103]